MTLVPLGIFGGYVRGGVGTCSFLIEENGERIVLDMGSGALSKLEAICPLSYVSAIIISHEHADHIADAETAAFGRLISMQLGEADKPIPFYGPKIPFLKSRIESRGSAIYTALEENKEFRIGPFSITPYRMEHECTCFGYFIRGNDSSLFYSADTSFSEKLTIPHADLMLAECSIYDRYGSGREFGHMNGSECAVFLNAAKPERTLLVHLPCYGDNNELLCKVRESYGGRVEIAECGREYTI